MTLFFVHRHVIPAAFSLLPEKMRSREAHAMLLAIGLQESAFEHRAQVPTGPGRGFFQFEKFGGVRGVLVHRASEPHIAYVLHKLRYAGASTQECYEAIEHNDVLACCFARLLLWTDPRPLPGPHDWETAWRIYLDCWRPGAVLKKPVGHPDRQRLAQKFAGHYGVAHDLVHP